MLFDPMEDAWIGDLFSEVDPPPLSAGLFNEIWEELDSDSRSSNLESAAPAGPSPVPAPLDRGVDDDGRSRRGVPTPPVDMPRISEALLCFSGALGVFDGDPDRPFNARVVQERVRLATSVEPTLFLAASACRAAVARGLIGRIADGNYVLTEKGEVFRDQIRALSGSPLTALADRIAELAPQQTNAVVVRQLNFHLLQVLDQLASHLVLRDTLWWDAKFGGIAPDLREVSDQDIAALSIAVPSRFRPRVESLIRIARSGSDPVLRMALAHVTAIRLCELATRGEVGSRPPKNDAESHGGATIILETSTLISMATPSADSSRWVGDAIRQGHRVVILASTLTEYLACLHAADPRWVLDNSRLERDCKGGLGRWWVPRAATAHRSVAEMIRDAAVDGTARSLEAARSFISELLRVPEDLRALGVQVVDLRPHSREQERRWLVALEEVEGSEARSSQRGLHDARLLAVLEEQRRERPLTFVVTTRRSLNLAYRQVVGERAATEPPPTALPSSVGFLIASLTPARVGRPWAERCATWALPAGHLTHTIEREWQIRIRLEAQRGRITRDTPPSHSDEGELLPDAVDAAWRGLLSSAGGLDGA